MRNFGVIGSPIEHTFSPAYFLEKFKYLQVSDTSYKAYRLQNIETIHDLVNRHNLLGFNVTIPHKESIIGYLDKLDSTAAEIGAVNVVKVIGNQLVGFNTDYIGFKESLSKVLPSRNIQALIFGSGGSSRAVKYALKLMGIPYEIVSRNADNGITYDSIDESTITSHNLLINTTPLGMKGSIELAVDIPYKAVSNQHFCFDLIYNPEQTEFLKRCQDMGAEVQNGFEMLKIQADKSWEIWNQ